MLVPIIASYVSRIDAIAACHQFSSGPVRLDIAIGHMAALAQACTA